MSKRDRPPIGGLSHKSRVDNLPADSKNWVYIRACQNKESTLGVFFNFYTGAACFTDGNSINWITADGRQQINLKFFFKFVPSIR